MQAKETDVFGAALKAGHHFFVTQDGKITQQKLPTLSTKTGMQSEWVKARFYCILFLHNVDFISNDEAVKKKKEKESEENEAILFSQKQTY